VAVGCWLLAFGKQARHALGNEGERGRFAKITTVATHDDIGGGDLTVDVHRVGDVHTIRCLSTSVVRCHIGHH
jgi:hypothetical protein